MDHFPDIQTYPDPSYHVALPRVLLVLAVAAVAGSNEECLKFLAGREVEEGVITLASGLLYKDLTPGTTQ